MTFAMRNSGRESDISLPYRIISCKSFRPISELSFLRLIQGTPADGLCAIDIGLQGNAVLGRGTMSDIWGAAYMIYNICAKENQDHIGGMAFSVGMYLQGR